MSIQGLWLPLVTPFRDGALDEVSLRRMARHYLGQETREYQGPRRFSDEAVEAMRNHRWPGNVRELKNVIERLVIMSDEEITERDLPPYLADRHLGRADAARGWWKGR